MNTFDHIHILLEEFRQSSVVVDDATSAGEQQWLITCLQGKVIVSAWFSDDNNTLTLATSIPAPNSDQAESTFESMLLLNGSGRDNGGLCYGLDEQQIPLQLMEISTHNLDPKTLQQNIEFFASEAALTTILLSQGGLVDADEAERDSNQMFDPSMMI